MTRLPDLERSLIEAASRLDGEAPATVTEPAHGPTGLGARWRRLSRRGHVMGVLAGGLVLGAVATGSAQVAGLDPFGYLDRFARTDSNLAPREGPNSIVELAGAPGAARAWLARAYVTRDGHLCVTGGRAQTNESVTDGGMSCADSDEVAQSLLDPQLAGRTFTSHTVVLGTQAHPRRAVVYGVVPDGAAGFEVATQVGAGASAVSAQPAAGVLRFPVDKTSKGLSPAGYALVKSFPDDLTLRLYAVEVDLPADVTASGDLIVHEEPTTDEQAPARLLAMDFSRWERTHSTRGPAREALTERVPEPVEGATAMQRSQFPFLVRPRARGDRLPARLLTRTLKRYKAQPAAARRLAVTGQDAATIGPVWAVPGGSPESTGSVQRFDSMLCLAGATAVEGCEALARRHPMTKALEAVTCAPGLPHDRFLVWGLAPAGATRARVDFADGTSTTLKVRDLLVLVRPKTAPRVASVTWTGPKLSKREKTKFPKDSATARCAGARGPEGTYIDLRESATSSGLSMWSAN